MNKIKKSSVSQGETGKIAKITYSNGWKIFVPKYGFGPMLFFEYYSNFSSDPNLMHNVKNDELYFIITLNCPKSVMENFVTYINDNL